LYKDSLSLSKYLMYCTSCDAGWQNNHHHQGEWWRLCDDALGHNIRLTWTQVHDTESAHLITEIASNDWQTHRLDKGMIHNLGGAWWGALRFHQNSQNGVQFKSYELFIFGNFHRILFFDCGWLWVTETPRNRDLRKGKPKNVSLRYFVLLVTKEVGHLFMYHSLFLFLELLVRIPFHFPTGMESFFTY
jgi:hypothetical protein